MNDDDAYKIHWLVDQISEDLGSHHEAVRFILQVVIDGLGDHVNGERLRLVTRSCLRVLVEAAMIDYAGADASTVDDAVEHITSKMMETLIRGIARALEM